jgi:hypothetical protein
VVWNIAAEGLRLVPVGLMASEAIGGSQRIVVVDMAVGARRRLVRADQGEAGDAVVERSAVPALGSVAIGAIGSGEVRTGSGVHRRGGLLPLGEMASGIATVRWSSFQIVIVVDVTERALNVGVAIRQQEACGAVIKFAVSPGGNGVAAGASRGGSWEARGDVVRDISAERLGFVPVRRVAGQAVRRTQGVVIVDVARGAGRWRGRGVRAGQSKTGNCVIKGSGVPTSGRMAVGAIGGSKAGARGGVNRIVGLLPLGEVASGIAAIRGSDFEIVIVVDVARSAWHVGVAERELKAGGAVIKGCGIPTCGVVAGSAVGCRESRTSRGVRRICRFLPSGKVASGIAAVGRLDLQIVIVVDVALLAGNVGVAVGKQKTGGAVIEFCAEPAIETVAALAIGRGKRGASLGMVGIGGVLPIFQVARIAARGESIVDSGAGALVAGLARNSGMRAE